MVAIVVLLASRNTRGRSQQTGTRGQVEGLLFSMLLLRLLVGVLIRIAVLIIIVIIVVVVIAAWQSKTRDGRIG